MINVVEMALQGNALAERCNRERMKLAFALYDVEIAHSRLAVSDPADDDHERCLNDLKSALAKYWEIDDEVERYLRRSGDAVKIHAAPAPSTRSSFVTEAGYFKVAGANSVVYSRGGNFETDDREPSRVRPASFLVGTVSRIVEYVARKVS